jgi:hypothetical protein
MEVGTAPDFRLGHREGQCAAGRCCATLTERERRIRAERLEKADACVGAAPARRERGAILLSTEQKADASGRSCA